MKISEKIGKTVRFDTLSAGDGFLSEGDAFIVVNPETGCAEMGWGDAVEIETGSLWEFSPDEEVIPVDMDVKWRFK